MSDLPKWAKIALAGAIAAIAVNYFINPTVNKL